MVVCNSFGSLIGIIFAHNFQVAVTSGVALFLILVLLCGFFVPLVTQHAIIRGLSYASIVKLTFESVMVTLYGLDRCAKPTKPIILHQLELDDDGLLITHAWAILGKFYSLVTLLDLIMYCFDWPTAQVIVWRIVAMTALSIRANDWSLVSIIRRKPKLKATDDEKSLTFVSNYLKE